MITHPFSFVKLEDVVKVYAGREGCACGCRGTWRYASWHTSTEPEIHVVNDVQVKKVFTLMQQHISSVSHDAATVYSLELGDKLYILGTSHGPARQLDDAPHVTK